LTTFCISSYSTQVNVNENKKLFSGKIIIYSDLFINASTLDKFSALIQSKVIYQSKDSQWFIIQTPQGSNLDKLKSICKRYKNAFQNINCTASEPVNLTVSNQQKDCVSCSVNETNLPNISAITLILNSLSRCISLSESLKIKESKLPLSAEWAQSMIGADLAKESLDKYSGGLNKTPILIIDGGFKTSTLPFAGHSFSDPIFIGDKALAVHGNGVTQLIMGRSSIGVAHPLSSTLVGVAAIKEGSDFVTQINEIKRNNPLLINLSMELGDNPATLRALKEIGKGRIIVVSSGNDFLKHDIDLNNKILPAILVGSLSPTGLPSFFSNEAEELTILAPSDTHLLSKDEYSNEALFGGTSGAASLVTGALANTASIIPSLTLEQARILLKKTAIFNISSFENPQRNGAGILNAYKLVEVAKRLKEKNFSVNSEKLLSEPKLYDFNEESQKLLIQGKKLINSSDCVQKEEALNLIRKSFLLNQQNESRQILADTYRSLGLELDALFYDSLKYKKLDKSILPFLNKASKFTAASATRMAAKLNKDGSTFIENILKNPCCEYSNKYNWDKQSMEAEYPETEALNMVVKIMENKDKNK
jgi:hypothetical protein